jgi:hypothetical protein
MDTVERAAQVLAEHAFMTHLPGAVLICLCDWRSTAETAGQAHGQHRRHLAEILAAENLLADTRCRKCNGTGGTDLGGACCAVCDGTGHRRAES